MEQESYTRPLFMEKTTLISDSRLICQWFRCSTHKEILMTMVLSLFVANISRKPRRQLSVILRNADFSSTANNSHTAIHIVGVVQPHFFTMRSQRGLLTYKKLKRVFLS